MPVTLSDLLTTVLDALGENIDPPVGRLLVASGGSVAWDDCCAGQAWVRVVSMVPAGNDPRQVSQQPCGVYLWDVTLGIGLLRCAATVDDSGRAPTPAALTAESFGMTADAALLSSMIQSRIAPRLVRPRLVRWDPLGPEGGCVGGEWLVVTSLDNVV